MALSRDRQPPALFQPDDEFLLHVLLVTKGITLLTRAAPFLSEQQTTSPSPRATPCVLMVLKTTLNRCVHALAHGSVRACALVRLVVFLTTA